MNQNYLIYCHEPSGGVLSNLTKNRIQLCIAIYKMAGFQAFSEPSLYISKNHSALLLKTLYKSCQNHDGFNSIIVYYHQETAEPNK